MDFLICAASKNTKSGTTIKNTAHALIQNTATTTQPQKSEAVVKFGAAL